MIKLQRKMEIPLEPCNQEEKTKNILLNVTESQELQNVSLFLEERGLRKGFQHILDKCMSFINNSDSIPVMAMLENICTNIILCRSFVFLRQLNARVAIPSWTYLNSIPHI